jgi:2-iminobutanoate/2-iminopropanoate deaminase
MKQVVNCPKLPPSLNSHAVKCGNMIFTSGQNGRNPETGQMLDGAENQARQALENLKNLLEYMGSGLDEVLKITIFVKDIGDVSKINKVYYEVFKEQRPARTCVEVSNLAPGFLLELEAIAAVR